MSELTYNQHGDYLIPNITLNEEQEPLGKYGRMRQKYLKEHRPVLWNGLRLEGKLTQHLREIDQTAHQRMEQLMNQMAQEAGLTEEMKASDPMNWVRQMNGLKNQAEEVILSELIYS